MCRSSRIVAFSLIVLGSCAGTPIAADAASAQAGRIGSAPFSSFAGPRPPRIGIASPGAVARARHRAIRAIAAPADRVASIRSRRGYRSWAARRGGYGVGYGGVGLFGDDGFDGYGIASLGLATLPRGGSGIVGAGDDGAGGSVEDGPGPIPYPRPTPCLPPRLIKVGRGLRHVPTTRVVYGAPACGF